MTHLAGLIRKIAQRDNHTFTIEWNDGLIGHYRLSDLQQCCPCAACVDENTGKRRTREVHPDVRAVRMANVGRYALRVQFTSGCSTGIYDFALLRKMAQA